MPYGTGISAAAMRVSAISIDAGIPCVSFFLKPQYSFALSKGMSHREAGLIALLYSVITQLACLLPTAFPATTGLDESQFRLLDGGIESVPAALKMIRALLVHAPPSLIWVLDGFQLVENEVTIPHLRALVDILRDQESKHISKVCFTTDGNCFVLMRAMNAWERVDASRMAQHRAGTLLRGGSDVGELGGSGSWHLL